MKKIFSTIMTLAMMVAALGFVACGGDDDNDDIDNGQGTTDKRLIRITRALIMVGYEDYPDSTTYEFIYDSNGRIIRMFEYDYVRKNEPRISAKREYIYEDNLITMGKTRYIIENGKIVRILRPYSSNMFTYENGYMSKWERDTGNPVYNYIFNWSDGLLESVEKYENNVLDDIINYEYTKYKNIIVNAFIMNTSFIEDWPLWRYVGNLPKYLISKRITKDNVRTYNWSVENGIPKKVDISANRYDVCETFTFEWE